MNSRPVRETVEVPGTGPFISPWQSKDNVREQNGGQMISQCQAEGLRKREERRKTPRKRPSHSDGKWEDKSILKGEKHVSPSRNHSLGTPPKGSRSSQNLRRRWSRTSAGVGALTWRPAPLSLPLFYSSPKSRREYSSHSWNLKTMDFHSFDWQTCFKMRKLHLSELGQFFPFLKQIHVCYIPF